MNILVLLLTLTFSLSSAVGWAMADGIAAVVNDDVITMTDVQERMQLTIREMGQEPPSPQAMDMLRQRVLQALVDESLQKQYADDRGIEVTPNDLQRAARVMEQSLGLPQGSYMDQIGANLENAAQQKLAAEMRWHKIVRRHVMPRVQVSTVEVDRMIKDMLTNETKTRVKIAQIFMANSTDAPQLRLIDIKSDMADDKANFAELAQQFSEGPAAKNGGDMGWFDEAELHPKLFNIAASLNPGEVSEPVQTEGGWHLIKLLEKADTSRMPSKTETHYHLFQLTAAEATTPPVALQDLADRSYDKQDVMAEMQEQADANAALAFRDLGWQKTEDLDENVLAALQNQSVGETTEVVVANTGAEVLYIADKRRVVPQEMQAMRQKVRERVSTNRRALKARQFMRDLRANAYVDIRDQ